jgi:hypothetical protein
MSRKWEEKYFAHILNLHEIFATEMCKKYPSLEDYLYSYEFLKDFSDVLRKKSSGRISKFLEPLSKKEKMIYDSYSEEIPNESQK